MVIGDIYAPDTVRAIPGVTSTLDGIYYCYHAILGWFSSNPTPPGTGPDTGLMPQAPLRVDTTPLPVAPDAGVDSTSSWSQSATPTQPKYPAAVKEYQVPTGNWSPSTSKGKGPMATHADFILNKHLK